MSVVLVSRHPGAVEWAARRNIPVDRVEAHLDTSTIIAGTIVIGTLPTHLAAEVCARGAQYLHLAVDLSAATRGRELSADDLERLGARLEPLHIERVVESK